MFCCNEAGVKCNHMATKSILKTILIKNRESAYAFARAIEKAKKKGEKDTIIADNHSDVAREDIQSMFRDTED